MPKLMLDAAARRARDGLKARYVVLRGHKSAIDALVGYEIDHKKSQSQKYDELVDELLHFWTAWPVHKYPVWRTSSMSTTLASDSIAHGQLSRRALV